ncbi:MAG: hypothetical protein ACYTHJ_18565 [Planctomycetota bacterium]|jgi:hypothetical protein
MRHRRLALGFLAKLALAYALLILPWPWFGDSFAASLRSAGNTMLGHFGHDGLIRFEKGPKDNETELTRLFLTNRRSGARAVRFLQTRHAYLPFAVLSALILASPVPWSRKWKSMLAGWILIGGFVWFRIWLGVVDAFSEDHAIAVLELSAWMKTLVSSGVYMLLVSPEPSFVVPVVVWLMVTFRLSDWTGENAPSTKKRARQAQRVANAGKHRG